MQSAKDAREARRRRILERGSDRLAYITGELRSSPVSPKKPSSVDVDSHSSDTEATSSARRVERFDEASPPEAGERGTLDVHPRSTANLFDNIQATVSAARPVDISNAPGSLIGNTKVNGITGEGYQRPFAREIVRIIDASEGVRALLALSLGVIIACQSLLLAYGHPWCNLLHNWLPRWPITLVLFIDFSIVAGALFLSTNNHLESGSSEDLNNFGSFTEALEVVGKFEEFLNIGMLCQKVANALSLDCCIYVVMLVCSVCLGQYGILRKRVPGFEYHS